MSSRTSAASACGRSFASGDEIVTHADQQLLEGSAAQLGALLLARRWMMVTAESCTGGWIAQAATAIAGSSEWFDRGFVTYSNEAKMDMLGVPASTLEKFGAVSGETARAMVAGALVASRADCGVAVTGIAGPSGGSSEKPVGTVWFGWCVRGREPIAACRRFHGDRESVRAQSVVEALAGLIELVGA